MKKWLYRIIMIAVIAVFAVSAFFIIRHFTTEISSRQAFTSLSSQLAAFEEIAEIEIQSTNTGVQEQVPACVLALRELAKLNSDLVGWLQIDGTRIDYPVMQTPDDPEYYLKRDFDQRGSSHGTPFVGAGCDMADYDNLTIYGHNMKNGSMFAGLLEYQSEEFYKTHPTLRFDTLDETGEYAIIAVYKAQVYTNDPDAFQYYLFTKAADQAEFDEFIASVGERQLYDTGLTAEYGDKLVTLSTCEYSNENGRMVVIARKTGD